MHHDTVQRYLNHHHVINNKTVHITCVLLAPVFRQQTPLGKELATQGALKTISVHLPHVFPQLTRTFQPLRALLALVRTHVAMRLHVFRQIIFALERPGADHTSERPIVAVAN